MTRWNHNPAYRSRWTKVELSRDAILKFWRDDQYYGRLYNDRGRTDWNPPDAWCNTLDSSGRWFRTRGEFTWWFEKPEDATMFALIWS